MKYIKYIKYKGNLTKGILFCFIFNANCYFVLLNINYLILKDN